MIINVTFSKPGTDLKEIASRLGQPFEKIKINIENKGGQTSYFAQMFTKTQVFHKHFTEEELTVFIKDHAGTTFKNCIQHTESEEITILANKKGKITTLKKPLKNTSTDLLLLRTKMMQNGTSLKKKNYILPEGTPVPFLVLLGIMTSDGRVIQSKYDKYRQINRFLEFIDDIIPQIATTSAPLRIADFGCGKSYLTFAVHYYLTELKKIPCYIEGLDLKQDVIDYCNEITNKLKLEGLVFHTGNIASYNGEKAPDLVITLHACDTATDFALKYAVEKNAKAILSVPCCQHQINSQVKNTASTDFSPLLKWGIIKEKFSALLTDALRGEWLESQGYKVQMLEFIDIEHTPKNILIRALKTDAKSEKTPPSVLKTLNIAPEIWN